MARKVAQWHPKKKPATAKGKVKATAPKAKAKCKAKVKDTTKNKETKQQAKKLKAGQEKKANEEEASGLKESPQEEQAEEEQPKEEDQVVEPTIPTTEAPGLETKPSQDEAKRPEKRPKTTETPEGHEKMSAGSLGALELSTKQLLKHEQYLAAVEDLKNGKLTDQDFLALFSHKQRQGLFKHMEYNRSGADAQDWENLSGCGARKRKQNLLLTFLKEGLEKSQVQVQEKVAQKVKETKDLAWVSWKKITDEYGEEEAKQRVKAGLIRMRRDPEAALKGLKLFQFLKVDEKVSTQKGTEQEMANQARGETNSEVHQALGDAIRSLQPGEETDSFFESMWLGKKPKGKTVQDFLPETQAVADMSEEEESQDDMDIFLAQSGLASGSAVKGKETKEKDEKQPKACNKAEAKAAAKQKKEEEKKRKTEEAKKKEQLKKDQWFAQVDNLSTCESSKAKRNLSRMSTMVQAELRAGKILLKKMGEDSGLKQSLDAMEKTNAEVEDALVSDLQPDEVKQVLQQAATDLKKLKGLMNQKKA